MSVIPAAKPINTVIFDEQDFKHIADHLANLNTAQEHIRLAKLAGLGVGDLQEQHDKAKATLLRIKNVYFPNR